jgi:hypothetical protein
LALGLLLSQVGHAAEVDVTTVAELVDCADGTTSSPGDVCLVQSGSYELTNDLIVDVPNLTVRCAESDHACTIDLNGNRSIKIAADRVTFGGVNSGFLIHNDDGTSAERAILIENTHEGIIIQWNRIVGDTGGGIAKGIEIGGTQRLFRVIENEMVNLKDNCIFQGAAAGGLIDAEFRGNLCEGAGDAAGEDGFEFIGNEDFIDVRITGGSTCEVKEAEGDGISFMRSEEGQRLINLYISCNLATNGGDGLLIQGGPNNDLLNITIEDGLFQDNGGNGAAIVIDSGNGGRIGDVSCRRSDFIDNGRSGLLVETTGTGGGDVRNVLIEECTAQENGEHGFEIAAQTTVSDVHFIDVTAVGNGLSGIRVATGSGGSSADVTGVIIDPSTISNNERHGILIEAKRNVNDVTIKGNTIEGNGSPALGWGIRIHALNASVRGVQIGLDDVQTVSNQINGNGEGGIEIQANSEISSTSIINNNILDNIGHGIRLLISTPAPLDVPGALIARNNISGSDATSPLGVGIWVDAANVDIRQNEITDNRIGVKVLKATGVIITQNNIVGNNKFGVDATPVLPDIVYVPFNWWGDPNGPANDAGKKCPERPEVGSGDEISNNVEFCPVLTAEATAGPLPFIVIGSAQVQLNATAQLPISVSNVPEPGLASLQIGPVGALTFDPTVIQVTSIEAVAPYELLSSEIDNADGRVRFAITNKTGRNYLIGSGQVVILTIEPAEGAEAGDTTAVNITTVDVMEAVGPTPDERTPMTPMIFSGQVTIQPEGGLIAGDVNGDGAIDITDARWVAEAAIGLRVLSPEEQARADVAPPFGVVDVTDARFIAEATVGLRTLGVKLDFEIISVSCVLVYSQGRSLSFRVEGRGVEALAVEVYDLQGRQVFQSGWAQGGVLRWDLLNVDGRPVANGVYLYVVTVRDPSGRVMRSEVRKLIVLR